MPFLLRDRLFQLPPFAISGTVENRTVSVANESHDLAYDDLLEKLYNFVDFVLQEHLALLLNDDDIADVRDIIKRLLCVNAINPDLVKVIFQYLRPLVCMVISLGCACDAAGAEITTLVSSLLPSSYASVHEGIIECVRSRAKAFARAVIYTEGIIEAGDHGEIYRLWWLSRPIPGLKPKWNRAWFEPPDDDDLTREQIDAQIASGKWPQLVPIVQQLFLSHQTPLTCDQWNAIIETFVEIIETFVEGPPMKITRQTDTVPADFPDGEGDAFFVHFGDQYCLIALRRNGRCLFLSDSFAARDPETTCPMERFVPASAGLTFSRDDKIEIENLGWHVGMVGQHTQARPMTDLEDRFRRGCAVLGVLHAFFAWDAFGEIDMPEGTNCRQGNNMDVFTGTKEFPSDECWCAPVWNAFAHQDTDVLRLRLVTFLRRHLGCGDALPDGDGASPSGGDGASPSGGDGASPSGDLPPPTESAPAPPPYGDGTVTFFVVDSMLTANASPTDQLHVLTTFAVRMVGAAMLKKGVSAQVVETRAAFVFDTLVTDGKIKICVLNAYTQNENPAWSCLFQTLCNLKRIGNLMGDEFSRKYLLETLSTVSHCSRISFSDLKEDGLPLINISQGEGDLTVKETYTTISQQLDAEPLHEKLVLRVHNFCLCTVFQMRLRAWIARGTPAWSSGLAPHLVYLDEDGGSALATRMLGNKTDTDVGSEQIGECLKFDPQSASRVRFIPPIWLDPHNSTSKVAGFIALNHSKTGPYQDILSTELVMGIQHFHGNHYITVGAAGQKNALLDDLLPHVLWGFVSEATSEAVAAEGEADVSMEDTQDVSEAMDTTSSTGFQCTLLTDPAELTRIKSQLHGDPVEWTIWHKPAGADAYSIPQRAYIGTPLICINMGGPLYLPFDQGRFKETIGDEIVYISDSGEEKLWPYAFCYQKLSVLYPALHAYDDLTPLYVA